MNPRERMRQSNRRAVNYLLSKGYDDIWLKPHGRRQDLVYTLGEWYRALDLWNLFDGICFDPDGNIILIQITLYNSYFFLNVLKRESFIMGLPSSAMSPSVTTA